MTTNKLIGIVVLACLGVFIARECQAAICETITPHSTISAEMASDVCEEVRHYAGVHGVDESLALAVTQYESHFRPWAISSSGAGGPMQIKPKYHCPVFLGIRVCKSRAEFTEAGVRHLAELLERRGSRQALRCYHDGVSGCRTKGPGVMYAEQVMRIQQRLRRRL